MSSPIPLAQQDVRQFIPHRDPMVLIDRVIAYSQNCITTETEITASSPYFDKKIAGVANYVGIEYMAQSIAALAGIEAQQRGDEVRVGFLVGSRKIAMHCAQFELGLCYQTKVSRLYQDDSGLAVFDCQIFHQQQLLASANINVFQPQADAE